MVNRAQSLIAVVALLLHVSAPVLGLVCDKGAGAATSLVAFEKEPCNMFANNDLYKTTVSRLTTAQKLDLIQTCSCAFLNNELSWASIMTSDAEALFQAIKKLIDETDYYMNNGKEQEAIEESRITIKSEIPKEEFVDKFGKDAERQYYWDRLTQIIHDKSDKNKDIKILHHTRLAYVGFVYDPSTMTHHLASDIKKDPRIMTDRVKDSFSDTCHKMIEDFFPFTSYMISISNLANNPRLFFQLTSYSDNLYKLRMNTLLCKYLEQNNRLRPNRMAKDTKIKPKGRQMKSSSRYDYSDDDESDDEDAEMMSAFGKHG